MRVYMGSTDDRVYLPYREYVSRAWRKLFGAVAETVVLDRLTPHDGGAVVVATRDGWCRTIIPADGIPAGNQAKVVRIWNAAQINNDRVSLVSDIDLLPLQAAYLNNMLHERPHGCLMCVGADVYRDTPHEGKFPMQYMAAESRVLHEIVNPNSLGFREWVRQFVGLKCFDEKEDISNPIPTGQDGCFSDESLMRYLISRWEGRHDRIYHVDRGWSPYTERAICRSAWDKWSMDELEAGAYIECHMPLPFDLEKMRPIFEWLGVM